MRAAVAFAASTLMVTAAAPSRAQDLACQPFLTAVEARDAGSALDLLARSKPDLVNCRGLRGDGALHAVVRRRDLNWLTLLLARGAQTDLLNVMGDTPLSVAVQTDWREGARLLLEKGATADVFNRRGVTPLIFATQNRNLAMIDLLIGHSADPLRLDATGKSAIDYAREQPNAASVLSALRKKR